MLLNLVSVTAAETPDVVWNYLVRYRPDLSPQNAPQLNAIIEGAIRYYADTVKPTQNYIAPATAQEREALAEAEAFLKTLQGGEDAELIQTEFYEIGKRVYGKENLRAYFKFLYQSLLGFENGPRLGTFTTVYGAPNMLELIARAQARSQAA
jgi:lysyl-tRNA synthetase class 1